MNHRKEIEIKNRTHYFLDDMINKYNQNILTQIKSRQMKSQTKTLFFTLATQKQIV